jgi:hypothetical protein
MENLLQPPFVTPFKRCPESRKIGEYREIAGKTRVKRHGFGVEKGVVFLSKRCPTLPTPKKTCPD